MSHGMRETYVEQTRQRLVTLGYLGDPQAEAERIARSVDHAVATQRAERASNAIALLELVAEKLREAIDQGAFDINWRTSSEETLQAACSTRDWLQHLINAQAEVMHDAEQDADAAL